MVPYGNPDSKVCFLGFQGQRLDYTTYHVGVPDQVDVISGNQEFARILPDQSHESKVVEGGVAQKALAERPVRQRHLRSTSVIPLYDLQSFDCK